LNVMETTTWVFLILSSIHQEIPQEKFVWLQYEKHEIIDDTTYLKLLFVT